MKTMATLAAVLFCLMSFSLAAQSPQPCAPGAAGMAAAGAQPADGPVVDHECAAVTRELTCRPNGGYLYTFTVTNNTGEDVTSVLVTPPINGGFTIAPQMPPLPGGVLQNGQSVTLQVTINGGQPGQKICFTVTLMTRELHCCTVDICVTLPNCCATISDVKITCNPDGTYTLSLTLTNNTPNTIQHIYLYPPSGVVFTPSYFPVNLLPSGTTSLTIKISGGQPGQQLCFGISMHAEGMRSCCSFRQCVTLPTCQTSTCGNGACCARPPAYDGTAFTGQKVAVVTGTNDGQPMAQNNVLTVFDLNGGFGVNGNPPPAGNVPPHYNGPASKPWTKQNLGSIFGVTIDHLGNIYVTSSSAYSSDYFPNGAGWVYRIDNGTGAITKFALLRNTSGVDGFPALGNIAFDCLRKQLFVTNEDDGRIYRLSMTPSQTLGGNVLSTFDHATQIVTNNGNPEPGDQPGFAPLGERLWGVQVHNNRVYYAVWGTDCNNPSSGKKNEIWSVGLTMAGNFDPSDRRLEITMPNLAGLNFSNPVSDISFSRDGKMLLSERTMLGPTNPNAHASRVLEYECTPNGWKLTSPVSGLSYRYNVGVAASSSCPALSAQPANAAGGNDYDFDPNATYGVWATGDALQFAPNTIYGFQGFPLAGGSVTNSPLEALYGYGAFKTQIGDIEISCPPGFSPYN